jgi:hypothetical protein
MTGAGVRGAERTLGSGNDCCILRPFEPDGSGAGFRCALIRTSADCYDESTLVTNGAQVHIASAGWGGRLCSSTSETCLLDQVS